MAKRSSWLPPVEVIRPRIGISAPNRRLHEKAYAGGRIPGNFMKRESRPTEKETLSARLTDHQIRPMFPKKFPYEIQVYISILSVDGENDADVLGMLGSSAALCIQTFPLQVLWAPCELGE